MSVQDWFSLGLTGSILQSKPLILHMYVYICNVVVQLLSHVQLSVTPWTAAGQASLFLTISQSFPKFMSIALVMSFSHLILWHPLLLPSVFRSIREFSSESAVHIKTVGCSWPKYWSYNFSIGPSNECSGLISLNIDWFDLLAVQGTLRSLLQHHNLKASILWHSAFFMVQLSELYVTTGKIVALTIQTFVGRVHMYIHIFFFIFFSIIAYYSILSVVPCTLQ